jgi:hypothetical protein
MSMSNKDRNAIFMLNNLIPNDPHVDLAACCSEKGVNQQNNLANALL